MAIPAYLQTELISHARLVRNLYKALCRNTEEINSTNFIEARYQIAKIRAEFDKNKNIADVREAKRLLAEGEKKLKDELYFEPYHDPFSPGGMADMRMAHTPDWVLDGWHPLEKAQYPYYFHRRDQRKKEYIDRWIKKYGKPETDEHH